MPNHTTRNVRHAKAVSMRELDKLAKEVAFKFWGEKCITSHRGNCAGVLDPHHVVHRGNKSVRFLKENIVPMCRFHHSELNDLGKERIFKVWFMDKYPERAAAIYDASRVLSKTGKAYMKQWGEYLNNEKEKLQ